jgi:uncharacterized lipoprotein YmbA
MRRARLATTSGLAGAGVLALSLGACVSLKRTPDARFFVLRSLVPAPAASAELPSPEGVIGLLPVRVPGPLERPQLVVWTSPSEVRFDELARWAEPLDAGVARTLAEDLAALLPRHRIVRAPWPSSLAPRCRLATELRLFGMQQNGEVRLEASFALLAPKDERVLARRAFAASRGPLARGRRGLEPGAGVDAMSELLADLAKQMAAAIDALPPPTP